jgi:sRNA-binding protein
MINDVTPPPAKWIQRMMARGVSPDIIQQKIEHRRAKDTEWAQKNREKKTAHKRAYQARVRLKKQMKEQGINTLTVSSVVYDSAMKIKCTYRPNWKEAPVYECTELNYRGKQIS